MKMKKQLSAIILAVGLAVISSAAAYGQSSEAIQVDIPFAFSLGNRTLPEGHYTIRPASDSRRVWTLQDMDEGVSRFLLPGILSHVRGDRNLRLTFHRYGSQHYLAGFSTASYEVSLPRSSAEKALRSPGGNLLDMGVITTGIETVAARSLR